MFGEINLVLMGDAILNHHHHISRLRSTAEHRPPSSVATAIDFVLLASSVFINVLNTLINKINTNEKYYMIIKQRLRFNAIGGFCFTWLLLKRTAKKELKANNHNNISRALSSTLL